MVWWKAIVPRLCVRLSTDDDDNVRSVYTWTQWLRFRFYKTRLYHRTDDGTKVAIAVDSLMTQEEAHAEVSEYRRKRARGW